MSNSETGGIHNKLEVAIHHSLPGRTLESGVSFFFTNFCVMKTLAVRKIVRWKYNKLINSFSFAL